jgi:acylphosphatase
VQGVGFRYFVTRHARARQLGGYVRNLPDGRVEFRLQGAPDAVAWVIEQIRSGPAHARVSDLSLVDDDELALGSEFTIR